MLESIIEFYRSVRFGEVKQYLLITSDETMKFALELRNKLLRELDKPVKIISGESISFDGEDYIDLIDGDQRRVLFSTVRNNAIHTDIIYLRLTA
jgi:hypothetical protein